jgi:hypothetical protein
MRLASTALVISFSSLPVWPEVQLLPTPQYLEPLGDSLAASDGASVEVTIGPPSSTSDPMLMLAANYVAQTLGSRPTSRGHTGATVHLWNAAADANPPVTLNLLDRQTLHDTGHWGQSYVICSPDRGSLWAIGSSPQGVLLAAMTIVQSIRKDAGRIEIPRLYVRDYPDFEYRAAADQLLNGEVNRWSLDRGRGVEAFRQLAKRKIDQALRYKINMIFMDGFGWGLAERFQGYAALMRDLNRYARERGIHLEFGGYGASYGITYQTGPIYEEGAYLGKVLKNRESYPGGPIYQCMGFTRGKKGVDASILGSCRSNEALNRLKGEELRQFVQAVEPGALYIHHEDQGNFRNSEAMWKKRCERCRERWPNDSLAATDGGAGGLANGYRALVEAVNSVKNSDTGYDAARDCQIILISPVYVPDSPATGDWSNALELWTNIGQQLPQARNVQVGFREVFPQKFGGRRWTDEFNAAMHDAGLGFRLFLYFAGGADDWVSDYPLSGVPVMNALFRGAQTIYNETGDAYREPMQLIAAEYSWNIRSTGFSVDPAEHGEALETWRKYVFQPDQPEALFGHGKLFERACNLLYGAKAGPIMAGYYGRSEWLPDTELTQQERTLSNGYLPMSWNRAYSIPSHWRALALDSKTWTPEIGNERYAEVLGRMKIDREELHRRLARRWRVGSELNLKGAEDIARALAAHPTPEAIEDLRFFETCLRVYQPVVDALADYHNGMKAYLSTPRDRAAANARFSDALAEAREGQARAAEAFPQPVDPIGGDVGAIGRYSRMLVEAIGAMRQRAK